MNRFVIALAIVLIVQAGCCGIVNGNGDGYTPPAPDNSNSGVTKPVSVSIGSISRILDHVWAGAGGALSEITGSGDMYNNYSVKITDGGKATLAFHNDITITLYNDTATGDIYGEADPGVPNYIRMKLERGGVLGKVAKKGNTAEISVAYGSKVKVIGTTFYVIYNEETHYTSIGNYDGELFFYPNGGSEVFLPQNTQVDIAPDGTLNYYELPNDPGLFDAIMVDANSPAEGLQSMRELLDQPPPGGGAPEKPITTVLRTLVKPESDYYIPDLAESWEVNDSGDMITFHLFAGVLLPNGEPFTASYVRDRLEKDFYYFQSGQMKIEVVDDLTLILYIFNIDFFSVMKDLSVFEFEVQLGPPQ